MTPDAELVRSIAKDGFGDAIEAMTIIKILEASNEPVVTNAINARDAGLIVNWLHRSLFTRLHLLIARAYSQPRPDDLHARRAFDLLKKRDDVRREIESLGFSPELKDGMLAWDRCMNDRRLPNFLAFRNKQLAHWGEFDDFRRPLINDIFAVTRNTCGALEKLANATGVVTLSLDSQTMGIHSRAAKFWRGG
jgi:hypothetical protein